MSSRRSWQFVGSRTSTSEDKTAGGLKHLVHVGGDVQNSKISILEHMDVVGEIQLRTQSVYMGNVILVKT